MGKETLKIMERYHRNKKRLNVLYEDRMVLERVDFVHAMDYTSALENSSIFNVANVGKKTDNPVQSKSTKCDKKTSLSDNVIRLMEKKNLVEFEINILKTEIQLVDNAIKALESETEIKDEFIAFRIRHVEKKSFEAISAITGDPVSWCWRAVKKMENNFEMLYGVDFENVRKYVEKR